MTKPGRLPNTEACRVLFSLYVANTIDSYCFFFAVLMEEISIF